ncbi:MAG: SDR family oxidoreductase [Gammaproteobacteria bacterium]|nr:SDR family oxidoreductase [Gammaproteobacteria bacterium]
MQPSSLKDAHPGSLQDRVAIVTGGASGIGQATCLALAQAGARVVVVDRDATRVEATLTELNTRSPTIDTASPLGLVLDVSQEADMQHMAAQTLERFGCIDILVACAGILRSDGRNLKTFAQLSTPEWEQILNVNLRGVLLSNRAVLPTLLQQRRGDILNVSSVSGRQGRAYDAPYCASKFGVIGFSESLAAEVQSQGIRVQTVLPDAVNTPFWNQNGPVPMPTYALPPERIADLIVFMLALPPDTQLLAPVIAPLQVRQRRSSGKPPKTDAAI